MNKELKTAKKVFEEEIERSGLKLANLVLFGSRRRGDYGKDSDWDFLVIVDEDLSRERKWELILRIKRRLAKLKIPNDIIMESEKDMAQKADNPGHIAHYALKEGSQI